MTKIQTALPLLGLACFLAFTSCGLSDDLAQVPTPGMSQRSIVLSSLTSIEIQPDRIKLKGFHVGGAPRLAVRVAMDDEPVNFFIFDSNLTLLHSFTGDEIYYDPDGAGPMPRNELYASENWFIEGTDGNIPADQRIFIGSYYTSSSPMTNYMYMFELLSDYTVDDAHWIEISSPITALSDGFVRGSIENSNGIRFDDLEGLTYPVGEFFPQTVTQALPYPGPYFFNRSGQTISQATTGYGNLVSVRRRFNIGGVPGVAVIGLALTPSYVPIVGDLYPLPLVKIGTGPQTTAADLASATWGTTTPLSMAWSTYRDGLSYDADKYRSEYYLADIRVNDSGFLVPIYNGRDRWIGFNGQVRGIFAVNGNSSQDTQYINRCYLDGEDFWFYYDHQTGRLHKMGRWWQ